MPVEFDLTLDDYKSALPFSLFDSRPGRRRWVLIRVLGIALLAGPSIVPHLIQDADRLGVIVGGVLAAALVWFGTRFAARSLLELRSSMVFEQRRRAVGHFVMKLDEAGLSWDFPGGSGVTPWDKLTSVESNEFAVYLFKGVNAWIIPRRAFATETDAETFETRAARAIAKPSV
jgi:hypothetical protein